MTEIVLDIPNGYLFLTKLVEKGNLYGFIQQQIVDELPQRFVNHVTYYLVKWHQHIIIVLTLHHNQLYAPLIEHTHIIFFNSILPCSIFLFYRGRKRFVSEGDGGTVKDPEYWPLPQASYLGYTVK